MINAKAIPPIIACIQKITLQDVSVTVAPPISGPRAGPMTVPHRNHPNDVARSVYKEKKRVSEMASGWWKYAHWVIYVGNDT